MINEELVLAALEQKQGGRVQAKKYLRSLGHTFTDALFSKLVAKVDTFLPMVEEDDLPMIGGVLEAPDQRRETTTAKTLVFTCAQSNTMLHENFFASLLNYVKARDAELHISRFTYNKEAYGKASVKPGSKKASDTEDLWFDPRIAPYVSDAPLQITPDLVWCGELNISPTRVSPLSTFKSYTRQASGIIPHAKLAMESLPTMKFEPAKFLYTTGAVTLRNYIQKSAGQVADFHHVFGALVVEIDENGTWWARQLNSDKHGCFYDLDWFYTPQGVCPSKDVAAITHGDLHMQKLNYEIVEAVWGTGRVVDTLRPREQHFHDTLDFTARNHHNIKDPHFLHEMYMTNAGNVQQEFKWAGEFLWEQANRHWAKNYLIVSNHDQAIETWLRNPAGQVDWENARFWHEMNADMYIKRENKLKPHPFRTAMLAHMSKALQENTEFILEDMSHMLLGEIECGLHGHLGPNGSRGSPKNLRSVGKANTAHTHSAGITEGVYTCGVYGDLDMGYNKGPSGWSHSMIVTYNNAKRAILTIKDGKAWR